MKIDKLDMTNFKSFRKAALRFPQLTLLLGSNASGKSNVRDALRFLHGVSRGYSLAEILGGAYKEGVQVWRGIRGGSRELCRFGENRCTLEVGVGAYTYKITIEVLKRDAVPRVVAESLHGLEGMQTCRSAHRSIRHRRRLTRFAETARTSSVPSIHAFSGVGRLSARGGSPAVIKPVGTAGSKMYVSRIVCSVGRRRWHADCQQIGPHRSGTVAAVPSWSVE